MADTEIPGAGPGGNPFTNVLWLAKEKRVHAADTCAGPPPAHKLTYFPNLQDALKSHMHSKHKLGYANAKRGFYSYYRNLLLQVDKKICNAFQNMPSISVPMKHTILQYRTEIKFCEDKRPEHQLNAAKQQHAELCKLINAKAVTIHPILLGSMKPFQKLGFNHQRATKLAQQFHVHSVQYAHKLVTIRRAIKNKNTSHSHILEPSASSIPPGRASKGATLNGLTSARRSKDLMVMVDRVYGVSHAFNRINCTFNKQVYMFVASARLRDAKHEFEAPALVEAATPPPSTGKWPLQNRTPMSTRSFRYMHTSFDSSYPSSASRSTKRPTSRSRLTLLLPGQACKLRAYFSKCRLPQEQGCGVAECAHMRMRLGQAPQTGFIGKAPVDEFGYSRPSLRDAASPKKPRGGGKAADGPRVQRRTRGKDLQNKCKETAAAAAAAAARERRDEERSAAAVAKKLREEQEAAAAAAKKQREKEDAAAAAMKKQREEDEAAAAAMKKQKEEHEAAAAAMKKQREEDKAAAAAAAAAAEAAKEQRDKEEAAAAAAKKHREEEEAAAASAKRQREKEEAAAAAAKKQREEEEAAAIQNRRNEEDAAGAEQAKPLPLPPTNASNSSKAPATFQLPPTDPLYTGRDEDAEILMLYLLELFRDHRHRLARAICVSGSTGVGRLTLCLDLGARIHRAGACPAGSRVVDLRDVRSMDGALRRLCGVLDMSMDENALRRIPARLAYFALTYGGPMLLLLANVEGVAEGSAAQSFKELIVKVAEEAIVLITSVVPVAEEYIKQYTLERLSPSAGQQLLQRIVPSVSPKSVQEVVQLCLGMPLLIRLIGEALASQRLSIQDVPQAPPGGDITVATVNLVVRAMPLPQQAHLKLLAVFPSTFNFDGAKDVLGMEEEGASDVLAFLGKHRLVDHDSKNKVYSLHTAVRAPLLESASSEIARVSKTRFAAHIFKSLDNLAAQYYSKGWKAPLTFTREHAADLTRAFELAGKSHCIGKLIRNSEGDSANLLPLILTVDSEIADLLLRAAGIGEGTWVHLQDAHEHCQDKQELLAAALYIQQLSLGSIKAFDAAAKAFDLMKQVKGRAHPHTASCLFAMAENLRRQYRYEDAEPLFREAVELREEAVGKDARTHDYIRHLGWCLYDFGHFDPAHSFDQDALAGLKEILGAEHPSTLQAMHDVACDETNGSVEEALFRKAYEGRLSAQGIDHHATLSTLNNLARCLNRQGRTARQEASGNVCTSFKGKDIKEGKGEWSKGISGSNGTGQLLPGKHTEAHGLYDIIIPWRSKVLGPGSLSLFESISCLAVCLDDMGDFQAAEAKHQEAIAGLRSTGNHPTTFRALESYARFLMRKGRYAEAEKLYQEAFEGRQSILGRRNISTLYSLRDKAECLMKQGNLGLAEQTYRDVMQQLLDVFGPSHKATIAVTEDLAACLEKMGKEAEAEALRGPKSGEIEKLKGILREFEQFMTTLE
ncbi:hypothetical protein DUNSADRAFT_1943 [Dunaliella salina]|uniref:Uncharacterized protein n=1 Tax=Dunaliella salina TaxID=3046 RepID=A0ABQ7GWE1_DUNSA|nr:hypothetical protein DUNSADRAFT_1943 [Dunaliella salina]|eukprot:KAF5838927.1 hypothetical protein DUNSADRAFT_1943 [Dunaliella salina]